MLLTHAVARGIAEGTVTVACRRWRSPNVSAGDTMATVAGVVAVASVAQVDPAEITEQDAWAAGAASAADVLAELRGPSDWPLYRIALHWVGPDPRDELSIQETLSGDEVDEIQRRLARLDSRSRHGAWTHATLRMIAEHPGRRAGELAELLGRDKDALKLDVRKLKYLGLTHSLDVGYRIAPRGAAYLAATSHD